MALPALSAVKIGRQIGVSQDRSPVVTVQYGFRSRTAAMTTAQIIINAALLASAVASAQGSRTSVVLTTQHFAFHSDLPTNAHDALIVAATARRAKQPELFAAGAEKACFDGLPTADRSQWGRAVTTRRRGSSRISNAC
jgi:hypothetical protein